MQSRLFSRVSTKKIGKTFLQDDRAFQIDSLECLGGKDVITANISDHHPIIHNGVLFWNCMMQGARRRTGGYNNAFGKIEDDRQYLRRLIKVARVISEIVLTNPFIETIGLCEAPNKPHTVNTLILSCKQFPWMQRFINGGHHKPNLESYTNWGLLMLCDNKYTVSDVGCNLVMTPDLFDKLANRIHLWKLTHNEEEKFFALAHFPFGAEGDEHATEKTQLSKLVNTYRELTNHLLQQYAKKNLTFCADFNFNPYLLENYGDRVLDKIAHNNSVLLSIDELTGKRSIHTVTVDGILVSQQEKQKHYTSRINPSLFCQLKWENFLSRSHQDNHLEMNRQKHTHLQFEYDKRFGLTGI